VPDGLRSLIGQDDVLSENVELRTFLVRPLRQSTAPPRGALGWNRGQAAEETAVRVANPSPRGLAYRKIVTVTGTVARTLGTSRCELQLLTMTKRDPIHAERERVAFEAFLEAHPTFAAMVDRRDQPDTCFPDVLVTLKDGRAIDFELGEWLHGEQMAQAKRCERLVEGIESAIGNQGENCSSHYRTVMLILQRDAPRFDSADVTRFHRETWELCAETEARWPGERHWHSAQGRHVRDLDRSSGLGKYLSRIVFEPLVVGGRRRKKWGKGVPWIFVKSAASYDPHVAVGALDELLQGKIAHYGGLSRPVRLLVYYSWKAVAYNTAYHGIDVQEFRDVAEIAAKAVAEQTSFEKVYLLHALKPDLEAFEIFPGVVKCD
jgi:hypothetical protein